MLDCHQGDAGLHPSSATQAQWIIFGQLLSLSLTYLTEQFHRKMEILYLEHLKEWWKYSCKNTNVMMD